MKKLRLFDSLKFVLATVACIFILNVAHADTSINSVIAYGKTEQSATPTPTTPVPIMTNNGVLKVRPNLLDPSFMDNSTYQTVVVNGVTVDYAKILPTENGKTYTLSAKITATGAYYYYLKKILPDGTVQTVQMWYSSSSSSVSNKTYTFTTSDNAVYVVYFALGVSVATLENYQLKEGSIATTGVYADGMVETIRDSAGHTATAQMLLGIDDTYRDEQNINTGAITRKVGVKVLDGVSTGAKATAVNVNQGKYYAVCGGQTNITATTTDLLSTHFKAGAFASGYDVFYTIATNIVLVSSDQSLTTVDSYNQYLAEQYAAGTPVIVVYPLATETTESVATQTLTTAPVRQTAGSILGMPIEVVLGDGTREWVSEMITIATTKYNEEQFAPVKTDLSAAVNAVEYVVSNTMTQAQQIDQIATNKQTRPDEGCTAKYCLLVEDEDGTPHWYPIAGANGVAHALPAGYTELQYLQSSGTQRIATDLTGFDTGNWEIYTKFMSTSETQQNYGGIVSVYNGESTNTYRVIFSGTNGQRFLLSGNARANGGGKLVAGEVNRVYEATVKNGSVVFDGVTYETPTQGTALTNNVPLAIFGSVSGVLAKARIYSVKATQDGVLRANYIPAKRNSDNALGMYDMVSGQFFTNAGTGVFTGPEM